MEDIGNRSNRDNPLKKKSFRFAVEITKLCNDLIQNKREFVLSKQLLRSGTAIGALYREAEYAETRLDFIHKLHISLKEANETKYWLDILKETDWIMEDLYDPLTADCDELIRILTAVIKTSKSMLSKNK